MNLTLFYIALMLFALLAWWRTRLSINLILVLLPTFLIRTEIAGIPTTWLELAIYIVSIIWCIKRIHEGEITAALKHSYREFKLLILPLSLWLIIAGIATATSPDLRLSAGALKGWWIDPLLFTAIVFMNTHSLRHIKHMIWSILIGAGLISTYGLIEYIFGFGMQADSLLNAFYKPANYVALLTVPIIILGLAWQYLVRKNPRQLLINSLLISVSMVALLFTQSYGGFLGLAAGIFVLLIWQPDKAKRWKHLSVFILIGLLAMIVISSAPKFQRLLDTSARNSLSTRLQIWEISLEVLKDNYILGVGLGNFQQPYREKAYQMYQPPLEWEVVKAHNLYLNIWLEMGLLGLMAFMVLLYAYGKQLKTNINRFAGDTEGWWLTAGSQAALIAILIHGLLDTPYFKNDLSILFLFIIMLPFLVAHTDYEC